MTVTRPEDAAPPQKTQTVLTTRGAYIVIGTGLALLGGLFALVAVSAIASGEPGAAVFSLILAAGPLFLAISIFRSAAFVLRFVAWLGLQADRRAEAARVAAERSAEAERLAGEQRAANAAEWLESAKAYLAAHPTGGAALVALRKLEAGVQRLYPQNSHEVVEQALVDLGLSRASIGSTRYGYLPVLAGGSVEIFRDYIIHGDEAHDVEPSTRGRVYVDGAKQVSSTVVMDDKKRQRIVETVHDMRTAQLQFTSGSWTKSVAIRPDDVNDARKYVDQLATHVEGLAPRQATVADVRAMVDAILEANGQPPAEKLQQLSNLRYERLLSDEEYERAKTRILGI